MYRVQQYPSTFVKVRHARLQQTVWDTTAGYVDSIAGDLARQAKEFGGWCGPTKSTHIPTTHPGYSP